MGSYLAFDYQGKVVVEGQIERVIEPTLPFSP